MRGAGVQGAVLWLRTSGRAQPFTVLATHSWEQKPSASASALKTTEMISLVVLWSKYFGHLDTTFRACEIKCVINPAWPSDRWADQINTLAANQGEGNRVLIRTKSTRMRP